jgi:predicted dehydrogenase
VEKPLTADSAQGRDLVDVAARKGVILQVGHVERFSPVFCALRDRLIAPRRVSCIRRTKWSGRSSDVDVILDLMIHDIDLVLTMAGSPVVSVAASGAEVVSGKIDEAEAWITFANGMIATLSASRAATENERKITITEAETSYAADLSIPSLTSVSRRVPGAVPTDIPLSTRDNLGAEIDAFLNSVTTGMPPKVDGLSGLAALEIAERIRAAIAENSAAVQGGERPIQ